VLLLAALLVAGAWVIARHPALPTIRLPQPPGATSALGGDSGTYMVVVPTAVLPNGLSQGACMAERPTGRDRKQTVFIDAGHGGPDPGGVGATSSGDAVREKDVSLQVATRLAGRLRADGYTVVLSRTHDTSVARLTDNDVQAGALTVTGDRLDTMARVACANAAHASVLLAVHFNAFSDPGVGGAETFFDDARPFTARNQRLAKLVNTGILAKFHDEGWEVPDRGTFADSEAGTPALTAQGEAYGHLLELGPAQTGWLDHPSEMPGALTEPLFLSRPSEADLAVDGKEQTTMAEGMATAIEAFLAQPSAGP
jgi:N-acetylmuramoyl-L-alanine amidase